MKKEIENIIFESSEKIKNSINLSNEIEKSIRMIIECLENGGKIVIFGNGGSAADAQHIAGELIGRFMLERKSFPAIALTTDTSILTAIPNDYSFDELFSRQCEGLVSKGDVVIGISTSGNSINVKNGLIVAQKKSAKTLALLGNGGGKIKSVADVSIIVDSDSTPRIQEVHRVIYHIICQMVEEKIKQKGVEK